MFKINLLTALGCFLYLTLAIFSFAYVDLNLTLNQSKLFLAFVHSMQSLGYYQRPIATVLFVLLILALFGYFVYFLRLAASGKVTAPTVFKTVILISTVLVFAYPFLSSDVFNYLFDSRILIKYHLNPYTHKALDFPQDDWIRFMRWTHRYSPYGPLWLMLTILPAIVSFGKFIINLFLLKLFIGAFHIVNAYIIYRILNKIFSKTALLGTVFYALNPILLIEGVVNSHNDVVLATFILLSIYFVTVKKPWLSIVSTLIGFLIKYLSVLNLPSLIYMLIKKKNIQVLIILNIIVLAIFTYFFSSFKISVPFVSTGSTQVQFQPWYLFWTLPLIALTGRKDLIIVATLLSVGSSFRYLPYLYYGDWSHSGTILFMQIITIVPALIASAILLLRLQTSKRK